MKRFIVYLVRKRLGLSKYEPFRFVGQKSNAVYFFTEDAVMKDWRGYTVKSGVSLNWLLDDDCKIKRLSYCKEESK
jgi:hypothetical protein